MPVKRARFNHQVAAALALAGLLLSTCGAAPAPPPSTPTTEAHLAQAATPAPTSQPAPLPPTAVPATATPEPLPTPTTAPPLPTPTAGTAATGEVGPPGPAGSASPVPADPTPTVATRATGNRPRVVCLDPGHGGPEVGAANGDMAEKNVNLTIALKAAELLRAAGYQPVLTRDTDRAVDPRFTGGGYGGGLTFDVQRRIDICNAAEASLFFSIHNNGSGDPGQSGTEVWYNVQREFSDRNTVLAKSLLQSILERLHALGYPAVNRGLKEDTSFRIFQGRPYNLYVLGPGVGSRAHVATLMPGVLGESLFLSNPSDAAMLRRDSTLDAIAAGYRDAVVAYFQRFPE